MELMCYNKGCGVMFIEADNIGEVCQYHPGAPVFHDAYKGWSCCKKRSTDFTEFLNIPGCAKGLHNSVKPVDSFKKVEAPMAIGEVISNDTPKMMRQRVQDLDPIVRPSDDIPKVKLTSAVASSLKTALKKYQDDLEKENVNLQALDSDVVQVGASCKHNACECRYTCENSNNSECVYHPGYPVFHEGYKFWSCCTKRTSDFNEFLKQSGCEVGKHVWLKPREVAEKKSTCRYDWHQTGTSVLITMYAKLCDPEKSYVEANSTNVHASLTFNGGRSTFELQLKLHETIDPEASKVEYMGTKIEIKLKKRESFSWPRLEFIEPPVN